MNIIRWDVKWNALQPRKLNRLVRNGLLGVVGIFCTVATFGGEFASPDLHDSLQPPADEIIAKAIERSQFIEKTGAINRYTYRRTSVTEEFTSRGDLRERKERIYEVVPLGAGTFSRLIQVNGKPLNGEERKKEAERLQKAMENSAKGLKSKRDLSLDKDLVSKFQYRLAGTETINGRLAYVLNFAARPNLEPLDTFEKILTKVGGTLWIDAEEFEISRIDLLLLEKVTVGWGGMLANIQEMDLSIHRQRMPDGTWVLQRTAGSLDGRQFLSRKHYKNTELSSDFKLALPAPSQRAANE